jgi:hypothetical protein
MVADPVLSLAVVSGLDVALVIVGAAALSRPRKPSGPHLVGCRCGQPYCAGVRAAGALWPA